MLIMNHNPMQKSVKIFMEKIFMRYYSTIVRIFNFTFKCSMLTKAVSLGTSGSVMMESPIPPKSFCSQLKNPRCNTTKKHRKFLKGRKRRLAAQRPHLWRTNMAVRALGFLLPPMCPRQGTLQKTDCRTSKKSLPPPPSQGPGKGQTNNRKYFWQYLSPSSRSLMEKPCSTFSRPNEKLKFQPQPPPHPILHTQKQSASFTHQQSIRKLGGQADLPSSTRENQGMH